MGALKRNPVISVKNLPDRFRQGREERNKNIRRGLLSVREGCDNKEKLAVTRRGLWA
ncbi:MAG: hypothetical protein HFH91_16245 [Lachnospiraceae bacterium]|nr:hypothetical protein [Lachnospiraceae bacterium]